MDITKGETMTRKQHADILYGYLARLSRGDLERIHDAMMESWHASANYPTSAQIKAQGFAHLTCAVAIDRMSEHDKRNLEAIIARAEEAQNTPKTQFYIGS